MRKDKAHFLGFELYQSNTRRIGIIKTAKGTYIKRTGGWSMTVGPDRIRLINRLFMKGYCERDGFPRELRLVAQFDAFTIIQKFNSGLANFYTEFCTYKSATNRWLYIIRYSALKTLAYRYRTNIAGVHKILGPKLKRFA